MLPGVDNLLNGLWEATQIFFASTWWFILFLILIPVTHSAFLYWRQRKFEHSLKWVFLEMKMPREILKSARAMDQVLQAIHATRNVQGNLSEKYIDGEVPRWITFEIVSFGGEVHFYLRCYAKTRPLIEAAFFAYYPDIELTQTEDYVHSKLPKSYADLIASGQNMWGNELRLVKEAMYPIRSYREFESMDEMHQLDPVSALLENLGKIKKEEFLGVQINCQPADSKTWNGEKEEFEEELEELRKPKRIKASEIEGDDGSGNPATVQRSPGQVRTIELIENNLAKPPYEVVVRYLYIAPNNIFYDTFPRRAIPGSFNQYADMSLNYFAMNGAMITMMKAGNHYLLRPFTNIRTKVRSQRLLEFYKEREMAIETFMGKVFTSSPFHWGNASRPMMLNTESLATIFHPPTSLVLTAPHTPRVESRKAAAPSGLQIYGDESVLDKFK